MKKSVFVSFLLFVSVLATAQANKSAIRIIPEPVSVVPGNGSFNLPASLSIVINNDNLKKTAELLSGTLSAASGIAVQVTSGTAAPAQGIHHHWPPVFS